MPERFDVVVVGAGILGLASAYHILRSRPELSLVLIDRFPDVGQGNTGRSNAQFRDVFSSRTNHAMANSSIDFFLHLQKDEKHDLGIHLYRYLWLFSDEMMKKYSPIVGKMQQLGVDVSILNEAEIRQIPNLTTEMADPEARQMGLQNLCGGIVGRKCGGLSAEKLCAYYKNELQYMNVKMAFRTTVKRLVVEPKRKIDWPGEPFLWQESDIVGVQLEGAVTGFVPASLVVNATGAWINNLLDGIGFDSRTEQRQRDVFVISTRSPTRSSLRNLLYARGLNEENTLPKIQLEAGPGSVSLKPQAAEGTFWVSGSSPWTRKFVHSPEFDLEYYQPDERTYNEGILRPLSKYLPQFANCTFDPRKGDGKWAGFSTMNSTDGTPYVFRQGSMIVVTGCSGSGVMKADAIGRIVDGLSRDEASVELYNGEKFRVSDIGIGQERNVTPEEFVL